MCSTLFFPIIPFLFQLVCNVKSWCQLYLNLIKNVKIVVGWFLLIALYLSSSGIPEWRVTIEQQSVDESNSCVNATVTCQNGTTYLSNSVCEKETSYASCTSTCTALKNSSQNPAEISVSASCTFVKYTKSDDVSWMQVFNLFGLYWGVFFFSAFGEIVLAGVFSEVRYGWPSFHCWLSF